ncbi:hypothetical protein FRB96_000803 [Tulasnella sp. 330]|nr:hypothetical protein FRB96_000803 [Tulasnella sp. 330]
MGSTFRRVFSNTGSVYNSFTNLKLLYEMEDIKDVTRDGTVPCPHTADSGENLSHDGGIKVEDLTFKYTDTEATVIDKLSSKISAGSTVVIVGKNGSGKSSSYKVDDLRTMTAVMYRDYHYFNLSLQKNIGLWNALRCSDLDALKEVAKLEGQGRALEAMMKAKEDTQKEFSKGQTQRLALSWVFMRSTTCDVRSVAHDQPSAALDPKPSLLCSRDYGHYEATGP